MLCRFDIKLFFLSIQTTKSILSEKCSKSYRASSIFTSNTTYSPCCLFNGKFQIFLYLKFFVLPYIANIATIQQNSEVCCVLCFTAQQIVSVKIISKSVLYISPYVLSMYNIYIVCAFVLILYIKVYMVWYICIHTSVSIAS